MLSYTVRTDCDVPYYKQLVDAIHADIHSGRLVPGQKLPTVRELAGRLGLACGTIKRAYDELEKLGDLEMSRGRGTFVRYQRENSESRKERAMAAIDKMLDGLEALGFSAQETEIFLKLKLQERAQRSENLHVALVECNQETLQQIGEQLHALPSVDVYPYLVEDVAAYPYEASDDMDIIVTTAAHYEQLMAAVPAQGKLLKAALRLAPETILALARLGERARVGILCHSARFGTLLQTALSTYAAQARFEGVWLFDEPSSLPAALSALDAVLVPYGYDKFAGEETLKRLAPYACARTLIPCRYQIDQGSYMYLEERVQRLLRERGKLPEA